MMPEIEGKTVAVLGQGPIGLMFNALLKLRGAGTVIGIDRLEERANVGREMVALMRSLFLEMQAVWNSYPT